MRYHLKGLYNGKYTGQNYLIGPLLKGRLWFINQLLLLFVVCCSCNSYLVYLRACLTKSVSCISATGYAPAHKNHSEPKDIVWRLLSTGNGLCLSTYCETVQRGYLQLTLFDPQLTLKSLVPCFYFQPTPVNVSVKLFKGLMAGSNFIIFSLITLKIMFQKEWIKQQQKSEHLFSYYYLIWLGMLGTAWWHNN